MAEQQSTCARARRTDLVVDDEMTEWTRYEGSREVLIERAGIPADAFDDRYRVSARIWRSAHGEREIEVRRTSAHRFLVYLRYSPAECERRDVERTARRNAEQQRDRVAKEIGGWSPDAATWRLAMRKWSGALLGIVGLSARGEQDPGFRFDDDTLDAIDMHVQAIRGLIESGTVVANPAARAAAESKLRAKVLEADPALAKFLTAAGVR